MDIKKTRGGSRPGAGRPKKNVVTVSFCATEDVKSILDAVNGNRSDYICSCILQANKSH